MNTLELQQKEKTAQMVWTGFILMFFIIQAIIWIVALSLTSGDTSHAVIEGYDQQALQWDLSKAEQRASDALDWDTRLLIDRSSDIRGNRAITVTVHDKQGSPVGQAMIQLEAFHCGRAAEVQEIDLSEINPGVYSGTIQIRKEGNWQFSGAIVRGEDRSIINLRRYIGSDGSR